MYSLILQDSSCLLTETSCNLTMPPNIITVTENKINTQSITTLSITFALQSLGCVMDGSRGGGVIGGPDPSLYRVSLQY